MKTLRSFQKSRQAASGLLVTIVMTTVALAILSGALSWPASSIRLNERSNAHLNL
jgi:hypothetical protein